MTFWLELSQLMVDECFNYSFNMGTLSTSQNQVCITLLEKIEKNIIFIENWKPISLINVDAKICSKALCNRMMKFMPLKTNPSKSISIRKGKNYWWSFEVFSRSFWLNRKNANKSFVLFAADFQKAFDSTEHNFKIATLRHSGFGEKFVNWIKILLVNSKSCILNNVQHPICLKWKVERNR